jgi:colanic acid/amylovoran biosynthesis protein
MQVRGGDREPCFLLVGNGGYENRGCEAIVRGTARILRSAFGPCRLLNWHLDPRAHPPPAIEHDTEILHRPIPLPKRLTPAWLAVRCLQHAHHPVLARFAFKGLCDEARICRAVLAVGGDNFTLDYGKPSIFVALANALAGSGKQQVLWGASVGPFDEDPVYQQFVGNVLQRRFSHFFVREELSANYLESQWHLQQRVRRFSDPAFQLDPTPSPFVPPLGAIGFNLSPMLRSTIERQHSGGWRHFLRNLAAKLACLSRPIVMIPHVTQPYGDDWECLREFADALMVHGVHAQFSPPDTSAAQAKSIIAGLEALVAARTHACIAGYSSQVPVLAIAYSQKASGIAESIFGNQDLVIPAGGICADSLFLKLTVMLQGAGQIRETLRVRQAALQHSSLGAGACLRELLTS